MNTLATVRRGTPISAIALTSLSSFRYSHVSHGGQVWGGVRAPLRTDLSAHALRRGERRHSVVIDRRKRRRSGRGDEQVGVADLQLAGALLVLALHDLDLVIQFLISQGPGVVGFEVARNEATFVEFEFLQTRAAPIVGPGSFLAGGFAGGCAGDCAGSLTCQGSPEYGGWRVRGIKPTPIRRVGVARMVVVPWVVDHKNVAWIFGNDSFGPAGKGNC
jgi:hypothetical protein